MCNTDSIVSTQKFGLPAWVGDSPYVLILGTFPGEKSLKSHAYYQNKSRNSFYKIMGKLFDRSEDMSDFDFITGNHIALWDCMKNADREGSLDSNIKDYVPNSISEFLKQHPTIRAIILNGTGDTTKVFNKHFSDLYGRTWKIISLSSTSNSLPMTFEEKLEAWKVVKDLVDFYAKEH